MVMLTSQKAVLFVAHTPTFLTELKIFGDYIKKQTGQHSIYLLAYDNAFSSAFINNCIATGDKCKNINDFSKKSNFKIVRILNILNINIINLLRLPLFYFMANVAGVNQAFLRELFLFEESRERISSMLVSLSPKYIVLGGDMPGYDSALYIKLARKLGIASFVIPSTMSNGQEQAEIYSADSNYQMNGIIGTLVSKIFPRWCKEYNGMTLFRVPLSRMLAMLSLGLDYEKPWIFNSSNADMVFLESKAMKNYYNSAGLSASNLVVTGSPTCDRLYSIVGNYDAMKCRLINKYSLNEKKRSILIAFPPDFFYVNGGRPQSIFKNHDEVVSFFYRLIKSENSVRWLISLHPSMKTFDFKVFEDIGAIIIEEPAYMVLPLVDLYIATVSSTIRWAISCGVPVLNFDFYRYRYSDFMNLDGVIYADTEMNFLVSFRALIEQDDYYVAVKEFQKNISSQWGVMDGECCLRILKYIQGVVLD